MNSFTKFKTDVLVPPRLYIFVPTILILLSLVIILAVDDKEMKFLFF